MNNGSDTRTTKACVIFQKMYKFCQEKTALNVLRIWSSRIFNYQVEPFVRMALKSYFEHCDPAIAATHRKRMAPLVQSRKDIFVRAILPHGDTDFISTNYAEYKWHPLNAPPPVPYYLFGDCVCIFGMETGPSQKIILISSPTIAATFIHQFDSSWKIAVTPLI